MMDNKVSTGSYNWRLHEMIRRIADCSLATMPKHENDYEDNGILYCGVCGEQRTVCDESFGFEPIKRWRMCKCDKEAFEMEENAQEEEKKNKRINYILMRSGMLGQFKDAIFENWKETEANTKNKKICERYVERFREVMIPKNQGLLFYGDTGRGKTWAAACIGNAIAQQGISVKMTSAISIVQGEEEVLKADLLIIDDFGAERSTEFAIEKLCKAIDDRYNSKQPFIITTNNGLKQMKNETDIRYRRMYERVFECCYPVQFVGDSMRIGKARERFDEMQKLFDE